MLRGSSVGDNVPESLFSPYEFEDITHVYKSQVHNTFQLKEDKVLPMHYCLPDPVPARCQKGSAFSLTGSAVRISRT